MHRKSLLSLFMLSTGAALIAAAMIAGTASARSNSTICGGSVSTLCVTQVISGFDTLDPQLAYVSNDWGAIYNTELTLVNYPTKPGQAGTKLIPQAAASFPTISNGGKTYTFHIRPGLKLSNGQAITAANFQRSFERNLSPKMYAPYGIYDGLNNFLVGGNDFANGKTQHIKGIVAKGLVLTINLTEVVPQFTAIMGMPWFQAIPTNMPYSNSSGGILKYASGGPYYIASNNNDTLTVLKRNSHFPTTSYFRSNWPSNPSAIVIKSYAASNGTPQLLQAEKGQVDIASVHSQDVTNVIKKYGVNKANGQFHVGATTCIDWLALNNQDFNNVTGKADVRKALNYAIGRAPIINLAGAQSGQESEQVLVPQIPGYRKITYYGGTGDISKAKAAGGSDLNSDHPVNIYYDDSSVYETNVAEYIQGQLSKLGMNGVLQKSLPNHFYRPLMTKATAEGNGGYNITAYGGWCSDYADGYDYINVNFDGRTIGDTGNTDYMYFNSAQFNKDMDAAAKLTGSARATAYGNLDAEFMHNYAPIIPTQIANSRYFSSKRVHNWVYSTWWGQPFWGALKLTAK